MPDTTNGRSSASGSGQTVSGPSETAGAAKPEGTGPSSPRPNELVDRLSAALQRARSHERGLRIRLHPPELGSVQIEVSGRGGHLSARMEVQTNSAQQAILDSLPLLKDALAQNGTRIEQFDVQLAKQAPEDQSAGWDGPGDDDSPYDHSDHQNSDRDESQADEEEGEPESRPSRRRGSVEELDIQV